ncbi:MAG: gliding motility-associated C-terminal domain-containing protein [Saprospiraceae bacterium]|nr:gliding motility-associated C-terminal domain-containing protein [Saprospiraceae bacterium]
MDTTVVCVGDAPIAITVDQPGGVLTINNMVQTGPPYSFNPTAAGFYTVIYKRGSGVCQRSDTAYIEVQEVIAQIQNIEICPWSLPFSLIPFANPILDSFVFSCPQCPQCIQQDTIFDASYLSQGVTNFSINYAVWNSIGCQGNSTATVQVLIPNSQFFVVGPPCSNLPLQVNSTASVGNTFVWKIDGQIVSPPPFVGLAPGTHSVELIAIIGECSDSSSAQIEVLPSTSGTALAFTTQQGCYGTTLYFNGTQVFGGYAFEIDYGTGVVQNEIPDSIFIPAIEDTATYNIVLTVMDSCQPVVISNTLVVPPVYNAAFELVPLGANHIFCPPFTASFVNLSTGNFDSLQVIYGNGQVLDHLTEMVYNNLTDSVITIQVTMVIFSSLCSPDSATIEFQLFPYNFDAGLQISDDEICQNDTLVFMPFASPWVGQVYLNPGDGTGTYLVTANSPFAYKYAAPGMYKAIISATDGCGVEHDTVDVLVNPAAILNINFGQGGCADEPLRVEITSSEPIVNGSIEIEGTVFNSSTCWYTPTSSGNLVVYAQALDSISLCPGFTSSVVEIGEYQGDGIEAEVYGVCDKIKLILHDLVDTIKWGNGQFKVPSIAPDTLIFDPLGPGSYWVELIKLDIEGCSLRKKELVEVVENKNTVQAGNDENIRLGDSILLNATYSSSSDVSLVWTSLNSDEEIDAPYNLNTYAWPFQSDVFTITLTDEKGCTVSDEMRVSVNNDGGIYIPNAFSPNGDGNNDVFMIYAGNNVDTIMTFEVFDRWGNRVFENYNFTANEEKDGWNGEHKGILLNPAVFAWKARINYINGEEKELTGDVTLVR